MNAHLQRKRKLTMTNEEANKQKLAKVDVTSANTSKNVSSPSEAKEPESVVLISVQTESSKDQSAQSNDQPMEIENKALDISKEENTDCKDAQTDSMQIDNTEEIDQNKPASEIQPSEGPQDKSQTPIVDENVDSPLRRGSQESTATTTTQTTSSTSTDSTSSSSESSSSSDSSSDTDDSTSEDDTNKVNDSNIVAFAIYCLTCNKFFFSSPILG